MVVGGVGSVAIIGHDMKDNKIKKASKNDETTQMSGAGFIRVMAGTNYC